MGLFSFIKTAGEKLFGIKEAAANPAETNATAAASIKSYIEKQNLGITNLAITFDSTTGKVALAGNAPSQEASEKATLAAGNVEGVSDVDNNLVVAQQADASQYHDVVRGDTLSAIAKKYYGDANKYMKIFEANKPMLSDPDKIYPGQKLRIPPL
ncbi:peptidoglycan-binding protein LysM [Stenoxybacter acetivorans]|uniref:peptidoglycan-binding protein LysM n=1 Tax=Stenoxybacter acetivorans TaxID=422441 RepID=UPI000563EC36|nr:peptidoglycan-binding protein LysM [Stenoxybacter acetivorans]